MTSFKLKNNSKCLLVLMVEIMRYFCSLEVCSEELFRFIYTLGNVNVEQKFYSIISVLANILDKCVLASCFFLYFLYIC